MGLQWVETGGKQSNGKAPPASWEARRGVLMGSRVRGGGERGIRGAGGGQGEWVTGGDQWGGWVRVQWGLRGAGYWGEGVGGPGFRGWGQDREN